ncbi:unnamed protein product [Phytomonas sp. EM1]|nr:unnamed protein product [Phytomonas sp. EM1]|eukprot:CCW60433.1 unnamed protein product [Phytomonas sp. isolate EM1]
MKNRLTYIVFESKRKEKHGIQLNLSRHLDCLSSFFG